MKGRMSVFRGFYTAATGMIAQQRRTEMLSNNIANANTTGYKADQSSIRAFPNMLLSSMKTGDAVASNGFNQAASQQVGGVSTGVYMQETTPNFTQGSIVETENNTDIALLDATMPVNEETGVAGSIFFKVTTADGGQAYTRNGNFTIDGEGYLTTAEGNYVLDENNERILVENQDLQIATDGTLSLDGQNVGRLGVAYSDDPNSLAKKENGLYYTNNNENLANAYNTEDVNFTMQQGFTEGSNVDASQSMTAMTEAYRVFEANQKVLTAYDRSMEKAVNEIGKV